MTTSDLLAIQLYTLRSLGDLDSILATAKAAGFERVETVGGQLADAGTTRKRLDAHGLVAVTSHVDLARLREAPDAVLADCRTLGVDEIHMPAVPQDQRDMDGAGWRALGAELGKAAEQLKADGITLGYHNHHWELVPKDGDKTALELIFEAAGSSPLKWQADIAWLVKGGVEPKSWLERYRDRLTCAHVKDIALEGENNDEDGWADVGSGVLNWPDLWRASQQAGARWMIVEHDKPSDPARCARASYAYLTSMTV